MKPLRPNKLTPGHNLKWESSRMMLPEHKEGLIQHRKTKSKKEKPVLDEQKLEEFSNLIARAMQNQSEITITLFDPHKEVIISGEIHSVHTISRQIKLVHEEHILYIKIDDILDISFYTDYL